MRLARSLLPFNSVLGLVFGCQRPLERRGCRAERRSRPGVVAVHSHIRIRNLPPDREIAKWGNTMEVETNVPPLEHRGATAAP